MVRWPMLEEILYHHSQAHVMVEKIAEGFRPAEWAIPVSAKTRSEKPVRRITRETIASPTDQATPCLPPRLTGQSRFEQETRLLRLPLRNPASKRSNKITALIKSQRHRARWITGGPIAYLP